MGLGTDLIEFAGELSTLEAAVDEDLGDHSHGALQLNGAAEASEKWWLGPQGDEAQTLLRDLATTSTKAKTVLTGVKDASATLRKDAHRIGLALEPLERRHGQLALQQSVLGVPFAAASLTTADESNAQDLASVETKIDELKAEWRRVRGKHDEVLNAAANQLATFIPPPADFQVGGVPMPTGAALDALVTMVVEGKDLEVDELVALRSWFDKLNMDDVEDWEGVFPDLAATMKIHVLAPGLVLSSETDKVKISLSKEIKKIGLGISGSGSTTLQELGNGRFRLVLALNGEVSANLAKVLKMIPVKVGVDGSMSFAYEFPTEAEAKAFRKEFLGALNDVPNPLDYVSVESLEEHTNDVMSLLGDVVTLDLDDALANGLDVATPGLVDTEEMLTDYIGGIASVIEGVPLTSAKVEGGTTVGLDFQVSGVDLHSSASYDVVTGRETRTLSGTGWVDTAGVQNRQGPVSPVNVAGEAGWQVELEGEPGHIPDTATLKIQATGEVSGTLDNILSPKVSEIVKNEVAASASGHAEVAVTIPVDQVEEVVTAIANDGDLSQVRELVEQSQVQVTASTTVTGSSTTGLGVAEASVSHSETTNQFALVKPKGELDFHRAN